MQPNHIAILTVEKDIHGVLVKNALERHQGVACHLISVDRICDSNTVSWSNWEEDKRFRPTLLSNEGVDLDPGDLQLIWWRRSNPPQLVPHDVIDPDQVALIRSDCYAGLVGLLRNEFKGKWINDIDAGRWAENKLVQLRAARQAGFCVPRTLVSNDPETIRDFCKALGYRAIVKSVRGTENRALFTRALAEEHLASVECLRLSPAIYQELVPGDVHLRVHCFGEQAHAIEIKSQELDWRENLHVSFKFAQLDPCLDQKIQEVLRLLGLRMGVVDLKLNQSGVPVWLEINPQGQFLFSEALSGYDLTKELAAFLAREV